VTKNLFSHSPIYSESILELDKIIQQCIKRNKAAEKELYFLYARKVFSICRRYSTDDQQAEDYMQDGFIKVFSKIKAYDSSKGKFEAWLSRVIVNTILSEKRLKRTARVFEEIDDRVSASLVEDPNDDILESKIKSDDLLRSIRQLPEKYQTVLNLFVFENLSHKEIANLLNIESSSSRSRFTRAKKLLKTILTENSMISI